MFPARAKLFNNREADFFFLLLIFSYCYRQSISHKTSSFVSSKSVETVSHCVRVCMCVFVCECVSVHVWLSGIRVRRKDAEREI